MGYERHVARMFSAEDSKGAELHPHKEDKHHGTLGRRVSIGSGGYKGFKAGSWSETREMDSNPRR